jgi:hypothetical protein
MVVNPLFVIPAKAGIHLLPVESGTFISWIPAFAGMTSGGK